MTNLKFTTGGSTISVVVDPVGECVAKLFVDGKLQDCVYNWDSEHILYGKCSFGTELRVRFRAEVDRILLHEDDKMHVTVFADNSMIATTEEDGFFGSS